MLKNKRGFTLLEVLLVVSLLGIILAITVPNLGRGSEKANEELCHSSQLVIEAAIEQHKSIQGEIPSGVGTDNGKTIVSYLMEQEYLRSALKCPSGEDYTYNGEVNCPTHGSPGESNDN